MRILAASVLAGICAFSAALGSSTTRDLQILEHDYYLLEHYRLSYSSEIYDYCVRKYGSVASAAGGCMMKQDRQKNRILAEALEQLGTHSQALAVYEDCLDYYPTDSAVRISKCVQTRLDLNLLIEDLAVEKEIYHLCDVKWRDHGYRSVDNCVIAQARYYLRSGDFRD